VTTDLVTVVVLAALVAVGCSDDDDGTTSTTTAAPAATTTTSASAATTSTTTSALPDDGVSVPSAPAGGASTVPGAPATTPPDDLVPDGTSFGYVTAIGIEDRTVTIDIAELLTGDAAVQAAVEDGALEPGATSIDNDYYVRNRNPKLRTAGVGPTAPVNVLEDLGSPDLRAGSLRDLAQMLTEVAAGGGVDAARLPVQITATGGVVTRIDQVFFP